MAVICNQESSTALANLGVDSDSTGTIRLSISLKACFRVELLCVFVPRARVYLQVSVENCIRDRFLKSYAHLHPACRVERSHVFLQVFVHEANDRRDKVFIVL